MFRLITPMDEVKKQLVVSATYNSYMYNFYQGVFYVNVEGLSVGYYRVNFYSTTQKKRYTSVC